MVKFEFPDDQKPLFLSVDTPNKGDVIQIHHENGGVISYFVKSVTYNFRKVGDCLFGSGEHTVCVKLTDF